MGHFVTWAFLGMIVALYGWGLVVNWQKGKKGIVTLGILGVFFFRAWIAVLSGAIRAAKPGSVWFSKYSAGSEELQKSVGRFPREAKEAGYDNETIGRAAIQWTNA